METLSDKIEWEHIKEEDVKEFIKELNNKSFLLSSIKSKRDFHNGEEDILLIKIEDLDKLAGDKLI